MNNKILMLLMILPILLGSGANAKTITTISHFAVFSCVINSTSPLQNVSLYINLTGNWSEYGTHNISGLENSTSWTIPYLPTGSYLWNCLARDNVGNESWAGENYTLIISDIPITASSFFFSEGLLLFMLVAGMILAVIGIGTENNIVSAISGLIFMFTGAMLLGFGVEIGGILTQNVFTAGFGIVLVGLSLYILMKSII